MLKRKEKKDNPSILNLVGLNELSPYCAYFTDIFLRQNRRHEEVYIRYHINLGNLFLPNDYFDFAFGVQMKLLDHHKKTNMMFPKTWRILSISLEIGVYKEAQNTPSDL